TQTRTIVPKTNNEFDPYEFNIFSLSLGENGTYDQITLNVGATGRIWVGLIEGVQDASNHPFVWAAGGKYYVGGMAVDLTTTGADGRFPSVSFPDISGFNNPSDLNTVTKMIVPAGPNYFVAYLEGWER